MTREERIYRAGAEAYGTRRIKGDEEIPDAVLMHAIAAMIAEATKPQEKRAKDPEATKDYAIGRDVYTLLSRLAPTAVAWAPVLPTTIVFLGKCARMAGVSEEDVSLLGAWLPEGLAWMREKPTTVYIARNLADLVAKARAATPVQEQSPLDRVRER